MLEDHDRATEDVGTASTEVAGGSLRGRPFMGMLLHPSCGLANTCRGERCVIV
jgi:hypothetical protein